MISEGYISALGNLRTLPEYWAGMLLDFPSHPVRNLDPGLRASIGCTLYGDLIRISLFQKMNGLKNTLILPYCIGSLLMSVNKTKKQTSGDEIDCLNDSWMFILWGADTSPVKTHSPSSRWPIAIIPASHYAVGEVNMTLSAITQAVVSSFNKLSMEGIRVNDLPSLGGGLVPFHELIFFQCSCLKSGHHLHGSTHQYHLYP